ncbi:MAG: electron transfer flavoprotein subunit beta/FixA family protein [Acidobacteria bacterium]|nr:electron transfer flavoprotein subunit beta/FixA family protein [Acidobacteriota bacterium]
MKIAVCIKQVPEKNSRYEIDEEKRWVKETYLTYEINESDLYALETALRLKDQHGGEVLVCSLGPDGVERDIKKGLAMGADRGILIHEEGRLTDPFLIASALAKVLEEERPDLILTGVQSDDMAFSQVGVAVAELLGLPHTTIVMKVEVHENMGIRIERELESGLLEVADLPLPAVLTIQAGAYPVRYASLKGIMQAKKKEIKKLALSALSGLPSPQMELLSVAFPEPRKKAEILQGTVPEVVAQLVEKLKKEAKVL